jgi:hypothetical protein
MTQPQPSLRQSLQRASQIETKTIMNTTIISEPQNQSSLDLIPTLEFPPLIRSKPRDGGRLMAKWQLNENSKLYQQWIVMSDTEKS